METPRIVEQLLREFTRRGYQTVRANLWHESCLYINVEGEAPFFYDLNSHQKNRGNSTCKIKSYEHLRNGFFRDAADVAPFVYRYKEDLRKDMQEGVYYRRKKGDPVTA